MAIQVNGQWTIETPNTDISSGLATASAAFTFSVNEPITSVGNIGIFGRATGNGPFGANIYGTNTIKPQACGAGLAFVLNQTYTIVPGVVYQVAYVWKSGFQAIYINGVKIIGGTSALMTYSVTTPMLIGAGAIRPDY